MPQDEYPELEKIEGYAAGVQGIPFILREPQEATMGLNYIKSRSDKGWVHEIAPPARREMLEHHTQQILDHLGYSRDNEHTARTHIRFAAMLEELTTAEQFKFTTFPSTSDEMVTLGPIPFYTLCAHHIVPFFGNAWVGYIPDKKIVGLSKIPRLVQQVAKGLHVQEDLTGKIASGMERNLEPLGVAVVLRAEHLCMAMRGIRQPGVITTTSAMRGVFSDHNKTAKSEFLEWVRASV